MKKIHLICLLAILLTEFLTACNDPLQEDTFSTLGPSNYYNSAEDAESLLNAVYANSQGYRDIARNRLALEEMTTDILIERQGAINAQTQPLEDFTFGTDHPYFENFWSRHYSAIFRANNLLDHVLDINMNEERKQQILAEARFLRALNYFELYNEFGPTPLITDSKTTPQDRPSRATDDEFTTFVETEFEAVSKILPAQQQQYGRATSGAALGFLCKFYLNQKDWANAAATAKEIIDSGTYSIFLGQNRTDVFALANEGNSEFVYVDPFPDNPTQSLGNTYLSHAAPPGYKFKYPPKIDFAAQLKIRSDFLKLFESNDERLDAFVFQYVNQQGDTVHLGQDDVRSFKYPEDPNGVGDVSGNDFPLLRYTDILLSRAEALNEINGPNQESIDRINQVREAAVVEPITLAQYPTKQQLRDFIFDERGREFHTEGLRRQDLIREGKFIDMAKERGKPAADYQVLFPIPQAEIDKNPNLEQNPGY